MRGMVVDAWPQIVRMLCGADKVPVIRFPADHIHVIIARGPDDEPDLELPPEPPAPPQIKPGDELILDFLTRSAAVSIRDAAAHLRTPRENVRRAVQRLRELGRITYDGEGWLAR